jgi:hypothetical protein
MATINPFQGPINYATDVQSPFEAALGGFKIGAAGAEIQQAQQKRTADIEALRLKNEKQLNYATGITTFFNKNPAERNYSDLEKLFAIAEPEQITNLQNITKTMDANKLDASKKLTGQLLVAFEANPAEAKSILQQRFDAETDPNQKAALKTILDVANIDPERAANLIELQGATAFGDDWYKGITAVRQERRTAELGPSVLAKSINEADESLAKAQQKLAEAADTPARLIAEKDLREAQAKKAAVEAKYAERTEVDKIIKSAADLGLTKAQTNKVLIENKNLNLAGKLALLDYNAAVAGVPLPSKNTGTNVGNATEDERKAAGWLVQADNAYKNILGAMYTKEGKPTGAEEKGFFEALPFIGGGGATQSEKRQQFVQAASSLSEALLRAATGAGQNENEAKQKIEELTPQYFDTRGTIDQKLKAIPVYLNSLKERAGRAAPKDYQVPTVPGVFVTSSDGKQLRFDNQGQADAFKQAEAAEIARSAKTSTTKAVGNK